MMNESVTDMRNDPIRDDFPLVEFILLSSDLSSLSFLLSFSSDFELDSGYKRYEWWCNGDLIDLQNDEDGDGGEDEDDEEKEEEEEEDI